MEKLILTALVCAAFSFSACGKSAEKTEDNVNLANTAVTTTESVEVEAVEEPEAVSSLPDKSTLEKIPDEAVDSFDYVVETIKVIYPQQEDSKRLYGYMGVETVNNKDCYVFVIYDQANDVHTKVATIAIETDSDKMYSLDEENNSYSELDVPDDSSSQTEEEWADKITASFAEYYEKSEKNTDYSTDELPDVIEIAAFKAVS